MKRTTLLGRIDKRELSTERKTKKKQTNEKRFIQNIVDCYALQFYAGVCILCQRGRCTEENGYR